MNVAESRERYTNYIDTHRANVSRAWEILQQHCGHLRFNRYGIREICDYNIAHHDESKYRNDEFEGYRKWWYTADGEEKDKEMYDAAWERHEAHNGHHWRNWTTNDSLTLPERDAFFVEMVCDWMAMSMQNGGTVRDWYETNNEGVELPDPYETYLYNILDRVEPHMKGEGNYGGSTTEG